MGQLGVGGVMSDWAIVTGASRGIGRATANAFVEAGWNVVTLSRSECTVPGVLHRKTDMLVPNWDAALQMWVDEHVPANPTRLCLVHNAAMMVKDTAVNMDLEGLRNTLELNVVAPRGAQSNLSVTDGPRIVDCLHWVHVVGKGCRRERRRTYPPSMLWLD